MKSHLFVDLRERIALLETGGGNAEDLAQAINDLFAAVQADFTFVSFELFQTYRDRAMRAAGNALTSQTPCFLTSDFLEQSFAKDPANYGIALALGVKHLRLGDKKRSKQLIGRVAKSGYKEHRQATWLLRKHFPSWAEK
jgi:hypothetical protein